MNSQQRRKQRRERQRKGLEGILIVGPLTDDNRRQRYAPPIHFNLDLIIGPKPLTSRMKFYGPNDLEQFERDFGPESPEYIAAQSYFQQEPNPTVMGIEQPDGTVRIISK